METLHQLDMRCVDRLKSAKEAEAATIWYYRSNVQAALQQAKDPQSWDWRQPHRERQILYLRNSRTHAGFGALGRIVRAQVTTNLANNLNALGRTIEAVALYDEALRELPRFAMALGNRGVARMTFARSLHDHGHAAVVLGLAYADFVAAASQGALWDSSYPGARKHFLDKSHEIEGMIDPEAAVKPLRGKGYNLGGSAREKLYRRWALEQQLFLNPLNVLGPHLIAATDRFGLPDHRAKGGEPPQFIAWFNQMKQEYAAARFLLFEADQERAPHFADRELMLVDTLDYPAFGLPIEKLRLSFRTAYSLLDKVAGFVNIYFALGNDPERVNLRNVWLSRDGRSVRQEFAARENLPLRGLYWMAFDIIGNEPNEPDAISPEAADLNRLRNALEHRCLVLRYIDSGAPMGAVETMSVAAFSERALTILKLAKAGLLYLSLAVHREEQVHKRTEKGLVLPMPLPTYRPPRL